MPDAVAVTEVRAVFDPLPVAVELPVGEAELKLFDDVAVTERAAVDVPDGEAVVVKRAVLDPQPVAVALPVDEAERLR